MLSGSWKLSFAKRPNPGSIRIPTKNTMSGGCALVSRPTQSASQPAQVALNAWKVLGCRDGGRVDLRCDASGRVNFIEVNPLAGLNPNESDLVILSRLKGISYLELIERIVASASERNAAP